MMGNKISEAQISDLIERLIYRIRQTESINKSGCKENIQTLEAKHDELKKKAQNMFEDLDLEDFEDSKQAEDDKKEDDKKKDFSATQVINFTNDANMKKVNSQAYDGEIELDDDSDNMDYFDDDFIWNKIYLQN